MIDDWIVLRHCASLQEAELLKSVLASEGIVRLLIHQHDAQRAELLLATDATAAE